jgi:SHS2 domain-containing protein
MFEILEHTADIGFQASGQTLAELFQESALALQSVVLEPAQAASQVTYPIAASGDELESLLVNWLNEVLYYLDGERVVFREFQIDRISEIEVTGKGLGEPRDSQRHRPRLIVKGITYHLLEVRRDEQGWWSRVFLDI